MTEYKDLISVPPADYREFFRCAANDGTFVYHQSPNVTSIKVPQVLSEKLSCIETDLISYIQENDWESLHNGLHRFYEKYIEQRRSGHKFRADPMDFWQGHYNMLLENDHEHARMVAQLLCSFNSRNNVPFAKERCQIFGNFLCALNLCANEDAKNLDQHMDGLQYYTIMHAKWIHDYAQKPLPENQKLPVLAESEDLLFNALDLWHRHMNNLGGRKLERLTSFYKEAKADPTACQTIMDYISDAADQNDIQMADIRIHALGRNGMSVVTMPRFEPNN